MVHVISYIRSRFRGFVRRGLGYGPKAAPPPPGRAFDSDLHIDHATYHALEWAFGFALFSSWECLSESEPQAYIPTFAVPFSVPRLILLG